MPQPHYCAAATHSETEHSVLVKFSRCHLASGVFVNLDGLPALREERQLAQPMLTERWELADGIWMELTP